MKSRRLLVLSKRFWPVSGETELLANAFATHLAGIGHHVDVVTWRMIRQWPEKFRLGPFNVIRMPPDQRAHWKRSAIGYYGRNRWHRSLQRWLPGQRAQYDAAVAFEYPDDVLAPTMIAGRAGIPTVSRVRREHVQSLTRHTGREMQAFSGGPNGFITPDPELACMETGLPGAAAKSMFVVPDGWADLQGEPKRSRDQARGVLARAHPVFQLAPNALLAICGADLTFESGVFSLVRAWRSVLAAWPDSRLWLIGSGKNAPELFQRICDLEMQHSVLLPGNFDEIRDVLEAADAYIMPGKDDRPGWYSHSASQLGLTMIHHQDAPVVQSFGGSHHRIPFDDHLRTIDLVVSRWAAAVHQHPATTGPAGSPSANAAGTAGTSMEEMTARYLEVIDQMVAGRQTRHSSGLR